MAFATKSYDAGSPYQQQFDYSGGTNVIYLGMADPGTSVNAAKWRIQKFAYDVNNNVTSITFASGSDNFDQIWANRASLTYK